MPILVAILLYNHPTLHDSVLMWALLGVVVIFRLYRARKEHIRDRWCESVEEALQAATIDRRRS